MRILSAWLVILLSAAIARSELKPEEVAILTTGSRQSQELAEHYAKARGVPRPQICLLDVKPGDDLSRAAWEQRARPAIRTWLSKNHLEGKVRCLVTAWDVPLRIGPRPKDSPAAVERQATLARARQNELARFALLLTSVDAIAAREKPSARPGPDAKATAAQLAKEFDAALNEARKRIAVLLSDADRAKSNAMFEQLFVAGGGINALLNVAGRQPNPSSLSAEVRHRIDVAKAQDFGLQLGIQALASLPDTAARDEQILRLLQQTAGVVGSIAWIDEQQKLLDRNESQASFDSELSCILWPDYPILFWQPNPLHYAFDKVLNKRPTLMVARLAAPKFELALKLVDKAIEIEKTGLSGKIYLDARGLAYDAKRSRPDSYETYDQSIRDLAERLKTHTKLDAVLDNEGKLFQPGQCPDTALYCGWYSLGKYVDAFTWRPGAVGYHIASSESVNLLTPDSSLWCPAMLQRGVAATLGPTFEPYLSAFPLPDDFFPLLLTGRTTLVETYYRTCPFTSWAMVLIGDPLYNPFKAKPLLDESALPERMQRKPPGGAAKQPAAP